MLGEAFKSIRLQAFHDLEQLSLATKNGLHYPRRDHPWSDAQIMSISTPDEIRLFSVDQVFNINAFQLHLVLDEGLRRPLDREPGSVVRRARISRQK
jgi:hypothetical protein